MIKIPNFKKIVYAYRNCSVIKLQVWLSPVAPPNMAWSCVLRLAIAEEVASAVAEPLFEKELTTRFDVGLPFPITQ